MVENDARTNLPLSIRLLEDENGKVVGFKGRMLRDAPYECFDFVERFPADHRMAGIVVRVAINTLIFDDSLGRGKRWVVPLSVSQAQELHGLFKVAAAYPHEGYAVRSIDEDDFIGFIFVSPKYVDACLGRLSESRI